MDWKKIEEEFNFDFAFSINIGKRALITDWFKNRIESYQIVSAEKLTEEEKNEFYTTNVTADIKPNYGK